MEQRWEPGNEILWVWCAPALAPALRCLVPIASEIRLTSTYSGPWPWKGQDTPFSPLFSTYLSGYAPVKVIS
jgi:hypothetical protein